MAKQRRRYTSEFKAKVALECLKNQRTIQELASHFELHPTQISEWKKELSERASEIFAHTILKRNYFAILSFKLHNFVL